jgi:hypothetical protein
MPSSPAAQVTKKIKLENTYKPELRRTFRKMVKDFKVSVASTGQQPNANKFKGAWEGTISRQVDRVQNAFLGEALPDATQSDSDEAETLALALLTWQDTYVQEQSTIITSTNEREQITALRLGRQALQEAAETVTNRSLALASAAILTRRYKGRVGVIAMSQTQAAAESTKFIEVEVVSTGSSTVLDPLIQQTDVEKEWRTRLDGRVRIEHAQAHGQRRKLFQSFLVAGESLRFPGDSSLGASAGNVINCRCTAIYHPA